MPRPNREPSFDSPIVPALVRLLASHGVDTALVAARFGLTADVAARDESPVAPGALDAILEAAADLLAEPFLALRLPAALSFRRYRFGELSARASATVREGLARVARYAPLIAPHLEGTLAVAGDDLVLRFATPGHPRGLGRHVHEYALAYALERARRDSGADLAALRVEFAHARPRDLVPLYRFFGTRVLAFGAPECALVLSFSDGERPLVAGDARLVATLEPLAEAELAATPRARDFGALVASRVAALLPGATVHSVARALRVSPRTLQRRLEDAGTRFSEVLDGVREERARAWLADPALSLAEIAARLGFADLATFGRAFKRWTGIAPGAFRRA